MDGFFPSKIVVQIPDPYILFVELAQQDNSPGDKSRQSTPSVHWGASNNHYGNIDDEDTLSDEKGEHDQADDAGSEDSDARRIAKTSSIQMGRMTFKVVGKLTLCDDLQIGIEICNMEEGRIKSYCSPIPPLRSPTSLPEYFAMGWTIQISW